MRINDRVRVKEICSIVYGGHCGTIIGFDNAGWVRVRFDEIIDDEDYVAIFRPRELDIVAKKSGLKIRQLEWKEYEVEYPNGKVSVNYTAQNPITEEYYTITYHYGKYLDTTASVGYDTLDEAKGSIQKIFEIEMMKGLVRE